MFFERLERLNEHDWANAQQSQRVDCFWTITEIDCFWAIRAISDCYRRNNQMDTRL